MKHLLVAIKDTALGVFLPIQTVRNEAEATRAFADIINQADNALSKNPQDFDIWVIGSFDDHDAGMQQPNPVYQLARGIDLVKPKPAPTLDTSAITTRLDQLTRLNAELGAHLMQLSQQQQPQRKKFTLFGKG